MDRAHPKHRRALLKFFGVLAILVAYSVHAVLSYGLADGLSVALLTWAFFVFATPIADAGFLLAFPIRLITGFRMLYSQLIIWTIGGASVAAYLIWAPEVYQTTPLLELFYAILTTPWPLGLILVFSGIGTYLTIRFDDELVDIAHAKNKKRQLKHERKNLLVTGGVLVATVILYFVLLMVTDTHIDIFG